jgi:SAM-dependent methyltransferase
MLRGESELDPALEEGSQFDTAAGLLREPAPVEYNPAIPIETFDVIVVFNFLHRPLFRDIKDGIKPGGVVVYQTYTTEQPQFGPPTNPAHLVHPGELAEVFSDWQILRHEEGIEPATRVHGPKALAGIVARKPE